MHITQTSDKSIINWQKYGIGAGETVRYSQPSASSISLNRVTGTDPTVIAGQLSANGRVWVINPNGLLVGNGARIDVGSFLGSTLNIGDNDFMNGSYRFSADRVIPGSIGNLGSIVAAEGGTVMLIAPSISNAGSISAPLGKAYLASGSEVTLTVAGNDLIGFTVDRGVLAGKAGIGNSGLISANDGEVILSAKSGSDLLKSVVNNSGVIEARTVENRNGRILLLGDMQNGTVNVGGTLDASAPSPSIPLPWGEGGQTPPSPSGRGDGGEGANGGFIETSAAHVTVADGTRITTKGANGGKAGTWLIDPVDFTIASGTAGLTTSGIGADTLTTSLNGGNVSIVTDGSTGGNGDIFVNSPVSWSANKLSLTAHGNININSNLNGSGTASLALEYGQATPGGGTANYFLNNGSHINLPAGNNFSTKLGSGGGTTPWTVITALGAENSTTGTD
jgi:filamentous hemagglutinin family protein